MSDLEDLKNENLQLKRRIKTLQEMIQDIRKKPYENIKIGHPHVGLIKWDDGTYTVTSKVSKCNFKHDDGYFEDIFNCSVREVKQGYTTEALKWIIEGDPVIINDVKLYPCQNIEADSIILHPKSLRFIENNFIKAGEYEIRKDVFKECLDMLNNIK